MYYVEVDECYMKLGRMTRCKVKVTDVGPKVAKMADFKVSKIKSAPPPGCIKRLVADHETGQYPHFEWKDFGYLVLVRHHVTFKARVL